MCQCECERETLKWLWLSVSSVPLSLDVVHGLDVFSGHLVVGDASTSATSLFQSKMKENLKM